MYRLSAPQVTRVCNWVNNPALVHPQEKELIAFFMQNDESRRILEAFKSTPFSRITFLAEMNGPTIEVIDRKSIMLEAPQPAHTYVPQDTRQIEQDNIYVFG